MWRFLLKTKDTVVKLEFKATDNVDKLEEISKEALKQIEEGKYSSTLKQTDTKEILYLGMAFCEKQIKISYEKNDCYKLNKWSKKLGKL